MDWGFISVILAPIFFVAMVVFAIKLTRKKEPVWAYKTAEIIGLGTDAPPELEMTFDGEPVNDVYRTTFIFFNKGNETVRNTDVTEKVAIHFKEARVLREPTVLATSKEANKFSIRLAVKDVDIAVELDFSYLDHNDGAVVEVLHTKSQGITHSGNIIGTNRIGYIGKFLPPESNRPIIRLAGVFIPLGLSLALIALALFKWKFETTPYRIWIVGVFGGCLGVFAASAVRIPRTIHSMKFPVWSIL